MRITLRLIRIDTFYVNCEIDFCVCKSFSFAYGTAFKIIKEPVTVEITRCLILNCTSECNGSITQVVNFFMIVSNCLGSKSIYICYLKYSSYLEVSTYLQVTEPELR